MGVACSIGGPTTVGLERATPPYAAAPATPAPAIAAPAAMVPAALAAWVDRAPSRASAIAPADANRSDGIGASALRVIAAMSGGNEGRASAGSGTGPVSRPRATDAALSPSHGRRPVSISNSTMPSAKMSEAFVAGSPRACSGLK